jgi:uncharacterized protein YrrD
MLLSSHHFHNAPLMSLQTGTQLASVDEAIIDPRSLKVVAYYVDGQLLDEHPSIIRIDDIREIGEVGFIIDSSDEISTPADIVRLQAIIDLGFVLPGLKVIDEHKRVLGRVLDYNMDSISFDIEQLRVRPPIIRMIGISELLIHRDQIVKITNDRVIVKSATTKPKQAIRSTPQRAYTNPFRPGVPQPEQTTRNR